MDYIKINEYPLERLVFGDNDYYDVDYYDGVGYQSAKILGSVIKAGILSAVETIYNSDGTLTSDRTIQGDLKTLFINNLKKYSVNVNPNAGTTALDFTVVPNGDLLRIRDTTANVDRLRINQNGEVLINEAYSFPLLDGTAGQVLTTDGAGNLTFTTFPAGVNLYNSDGVITGTRVVNVNNNFLTFDNAYNVRFNTTGVPFGVSGFEINAQPLGTLFTVRNATTNIPLIKVSNTKVFICNEYSLPEVDGVTDAILTTDGAGICSFKLPFNISSTQWSNTLPSPVTIPSGTFANGFNFFTDANKVAGGTTPYNEFNVSYGRKLTLTGTSGTANISFNANNYPITFSTNLNTTAQNWVNTYAPTFNANGIQVYNVNGVIRFGSLSSIDLSNIAITNTSGTLSGTLDTPINDHVVIPYVGTEYEGYRIHHTLRVNFNLATGNQQYYRLALVRWQNDTIVGSYLIVERNNLLTGYQYVFESYTAGALDPFVTGGFYFALFNDTGQNVQFTDGAGILIQNTFQKPINF